MESIYHINGLLHWPEREIKRREHFTALFSDVVSSFLREQNKAWEIERVEAPTMLPMALVNPNYTADDLWCFMRHDADEPMLVARPETTPSTHAWMAHRLSGHTGIRLPYCCWQVGKSFRVEQDKVLSHMRLKEFWQQEFQCAYSIDTANDYQEKCLEPMRRMIGFATRLPTRLVESDRLPSYSQRTMDIEVDTGERWMEVCSISRRTDFPVKNRYQNKKKEWFETEVLVLEIAIGLDRCVYAASLAEDRL